MRDLTKQSFGQFTLNQQIGKGGMSTVYRARQASIGREVAVKVLLSTLVELDETFIERFNREVQISASLQHPHILPVYDYGLHDGLPYIVMAFLGGGTLAGRIEQGPMSLSEAMPIVAQISQALDFAHEHGIIHRDIKPSNVILDGKGNAYLADFGLAKVSDTALQLTGSRLVGTPDYMAPELSTNEEITPAVDIYALGVTLFQMLTGHVPFRATSPVGVMMAHVSQPIPDVLSERPDLPETIQQIISTAMAKRAVDRYPSAGNFYEALRTASTEPQHTPHAVLFTDIDGQVIFVNSSLLKLLGRDESEARWIVGQPLNKILGVSRDTISRLMSEVSKIGRIYSHPLDIHTPQGERIPVYLTAEATYDEKGSCIGADLSFRIPDERIDDIHVDEDSQAYDTSERSLLQLYVTSQLDALRVLLIRIGGSQLGETLERILNETSQRNGWKMKFENGRLSESPLVVEPSIHQALLTKGVYYATKVIGPGIVKRQMQAVDDQLGEPSVALANKLGLRELIESRL